MPRVQLSFPRLNSWCRFTFDLFLPNLCISTVHSKYEKHP